MKLDLNDRESITFENVAKLIGSKDDSVHRQLRVSREGIVYLSDSFGNLDLDNVAISFPTFDIGLRQCGEVAANNIDYVERICKTLLESWPTTKPIKIDAF